jgi:hypothetical protein
MPAPTDPANPNAISDHIETHDIGKHIAVREAVGVFDNQTALQAAIDELMLAGFQQFELGLLDHEGAPDAAPHHLADDPAVPRKTYVAPESVGDAQGGLIAGFALLPAMGAAAATAGAGAAIAATAAVTAATGGVGALVGGALAYAITRNRDKGIAAQEDSGGLLLWVRVRSPEHEQQALDILARNAAHHVHAHD